MATGMFTDHEVDSIIHSKIDPGFVTRRLEYYRSSWIFKQAHCALLRVYQRFRAACNSITSTAAIVTVEGNPSSRPQSSERFFLLAADTNLDVELQAALQFVESRIPVRQCQAVPSPVVLTTIPEHSCVEGLAPLFKHAGSSNVVHNYLVGSQMV